MLLAGSGELWNAARSVTILGRLPMDESVTYVTQEKLNVGAKARSILFHTQTVGVKNKAGAEVETVRAVLAATTEKHYKEWPTSRCHWSRRSGMPRSPSWPF